MRRSVPWASFNRQPKGPLIVCIALAVSFTGCGERPPPQSASGPEPPRPQLATPGQSSGTAGAVQAESDAAAGPKAPAPSAVSDAATTQSTETPRTVDLPPVDPSRHRGIRETAFAAELSKLGHDPSRLSPLEQLSKMQKLDTMELISRSLGVDCTYCHVSESDYQADTRRKQIARRMWAELTAPYHLTAGPVFCDSCHQGSPHVLQRTRKGDVKQYMKQEYGMLLSGGGQAAKCVDCHDKPFQPNIFEQLWGIDAGSPALNHAPAEGE